MDFAKSKRAKEIFGVATDLPSGVVDAYVAVECGDDPALLREVKLLLAKHQAPADGLDRPLLKIDSMDLGFAPAAFSPGQMLGMYRIERPLGFGLSGIVYLATQLMPVSRRVAIKVAQAFSHDDAARARFDLERQMLASLKHPGIAQFYDAGKTDDGRPYFVMEYVDGKPIVEHCSDMPMKERLTLFKEVCAAVHHAHLRGFIHRDLKSANILTTEIEGRIYPKVIDFGIGKLINAPTPGKEITGGGWLVGTLEYMSPEQLESARDIDLRTDIYALGAVLYQMLTGSIPLPIADQPLPEAVRIIKEVEPLPPSERLEQLSGDSPRHRTMIRQLRGDLDWITLCALEKNKERRYASVATLAADVDRHLRNHPVEASPPSQAYRVRKFVQRHRSGVSAVGGIGLTLVLATALSVYWAIKAERAQRHEAWVGYCANIAGAGNWLAAVGGLADIDEVSKLLAGADEGLRDWEWGYLTERAAAISPALFTAGNRVTSFARIAGTDAIALGTTPGEIEIWDCRLRTIIKRLKLKDFPVSALAFDATAQRLFAASQEGEICAWDRGDAWSSRKTILIAGESVTALAVSAEGKFLAVGTSGGQVKLLDTATRAVVRTWAGAQPSLQGRPAKVRTLRLSSGETPRVVAGFDNGTVLSWVFAESDAQWTWTCSDRQPIWSVDISARSDLVAVGCNDGRIQVLDGATGAAKFPLERHGACVRSVRFDESGAKLLSCSNDRSVRVWDLQFHHTLMARLAHADGVIDATFSPDGASVLSVGSGGDVRWSTPINRPVVLAAHESDVRLVAWGGSGDCFFTASVDGCIKCWDAASGELRRSTTGPSHEFRTLARTPDGQKLAVGAPVGVVQLLDAHTLDVSGPSFQRASAQIWSLCFSPDGSTLVGALENGSVVLWNTRTGQQQCTFAGTPGERAQCCTWLPHGEAFAVGTIGGKLRVFEADGSRMHTLPDLGSPVNSLAYSPDGLLLAATLSDGRALVLDPSSGRVEGTLAHRSEVHGLAWTPNGRRLFTGGRAGTIHVWDVSNLAEVLTLQTASGNRVLCLSMSGDGRSLVAGLQGGQAIVFEGKAAISPTTTP